MSAHDDCELKRFIERELDERDPAREYLQEIQKFPVITDREATELLNHIKAGDDKMEESLKRLIKGYFRLPIAVARRYQGRGESLMNLIQAGNQTMIAAIHSYQMSFEHPFAFYASWRIEQALRSALELNSAESLMADARVALDLGLKDEARLLLENAIALGRSAGVPDRSFAEALDLLKSI